MSSAGAFDAEAWRRAASWELLRSSFDRMKLLRELLDGDLTLSEANHAAWRGLGYRLASDGTLRTADGAMCASPPDLFGEGGAAILAQLEAQLPLGDSLDGEEELEMLDTLVESLHGEELTRALVTEGDVEFLARRTLVRWLYLTQPLLGLS